MLIVPGEQDTVANVSLTATLDRFAMDPNLSFVRKAYLVTTDTGHSVIINNHIVKVIFPCFYTLKSPPLNIRKQDFD